MRQETPFCYFTARYRMRLDVKRCLKVFKIRQDLQAIVRHDGLKALDEAFSDLLYRRSANLALSGDILNVGGWA